MVLIAIGIDPNLEVPRALGLPIEGSGVRVDEGLRAADGVYCAGDIALHPHPVLGESIRVEHWEVAKHHGRGIATSIASGVMVRGPAMPALAIRTSIFPFAFTAS